MSAHQARLNFDLAAGEAAKKRGMDLAAEKQPTKLAIGQQFAIEIAKRQGEVSADDVQKKLIELNLGSLGPAAGKLFPKEIFEFTGRLKKSARESNHGRENRIWRLK